MLRQSGPVSNVGSADVTAGEMTESARQDSTSLPILGVDRQSSWFRRSGACSGSALHSWSQPTTEWHGDESPDREEVDKMKFRKSMIVLGVAAMAGLTACGPLPPEPQEPVSPPELVSLGNGNVLGNQSVNDSSTAAAVSANGDVVAFVSHASNLVAGDTNNTPDLFVRVRSTGEVTRIAEDVLKSVRLSSDGRYVSYTDLSTMSVHDRRLGTTVTWPASEASLGMRHPAAVSSDGSVAIYGSIGSYGFGTTPPSDCKVRNLATGQEALCAAVAGDTGPGVARLLGVSANGRFVAYRWSGVMGSGIRLWDRATNTLTTPAGDFAGVDYLNISDDGNFFAVRQAVPGGLVPAVIDVAAMTISVPPAYTPNGLPNVAGMSRDGRYVSFWTLDDLDPADVDSESDMYVWDRTAGTVKLASRSAVGGPSNGPVFGCGVLVAPSSVTDSGAACFGAQDGLTADDTNGAWDIYLSGV